MVGTLAARVMVNSYAQAAAAAVSWIWIMSASDTADYRRLSILPIYRAAGSPTAAVETAREATAASPKPPDHASNTHPRPRHTPPHMGSSHGMKAVAFCCQTSRQLCDSSHPPSTKLHMRP
jgi:hypothetical protein